MKKVLFIALMAIFAVNASAQDIAFSVNAGVGMANFYGDGTDESDAKFAYKVGVGMEVPFTEMWSLQTGLNFVSKGAKGDLEGVADTKINALYLELPVMAGVRFAAGNDFNVLLKAGPYLAYGVGGKIKTEATTGADIIDDNAKGEVDTFGDNTMKRFDAGLGCGVSFEFSEFVIGLDGHFGLTNIAQKSGDGFSPKNISAFLTLGYRF